VPTVVRFALPETGEEATALADDRRLDHDHPMNTILLIIAAILVIFGIFRIVRGDILWGIVLIVVGLLVGPGGVSIFS
jgi:membrane protein required for beta-lactamase induction